MKLLENESISAMTSGEDCAGLLIEVVPAVMRLIRAEMRNHRTVGMSVPQFRALAFLGRRPGASLSDVAEHIGLTLPTISKLIDRLEVAGLVTRRNGFKDRRRIALELTPAGHSTLETATSATRARLINLVSELPPEARAEIAWAMQALREALATGSKPAGNSGSGG